ncbi:MAG TPA: TonB-dependent receptor, partial [Ferruginibacter sp.]|nr:TonB-dependent receptor [Ferruginibacter sp.]
DDWIVSPKFTIQAGLRVDYNNSYAAALLPRLSLKYRFNDEFTTRLGGGMGYKVPSVFSSDIDERELKDHNLAAGILTERSYGANWDINYKKNIEGWRLTVNQSFYITQINRPVIEDSSNGIKHIFINAAKGLSTKGSETYIVLLHKGIQAYLGYTYTDARQLYDPTQPHIPLSAKSKFATVISNEFSERFRACMETNWTGRQYLSDGTQVPGFVTFAAMVRYDIKNFSFVLNCENIFDYRQTSKEDIIIPPISNPDFKELWAPIDGRVLNLSVKISL